MDMHASAPILLLICNVLVLLVAAHLYLGDIRTSDQSSKIIKHLIISGYSNRRMHVYSCTESGPAKESKRQGCAEVLLSLLWP